MFCYQSTAPFLHIGALVTVTAISWLVAGYVVRRERSSKCWPKFSSACPRHQPGRMRLWFIWLIDPSWSRDDGSTTVQEWTVILQPGLGLRQKRPVKTTTVGDPKTDYNSIAWLICCNQYCDCLEKIKKIDTHQIHFCNEVFSILLRHLSCYTYKCTHIWQWKRFSEGLFVGMWNYHIGA